MHNEIRKIIRETIYLLQEKYMDDVSLEDLGGYKKISNDWFNSSPDYLYDSYRYEVLGGETSLGYEEAEKVTEMDNDEIDETDDFKNWLEYKIDFRFNKAIENIEQESTVENGRIKLWREMTVSEDYIKHLLTQGKHLGIYWSFTDSAAEAYWANSKKKLYVKLESSVDKSQINWETTIELNMNPTGEDEKEIRLFQNTPLKIEAMWISYDSFSGSYESIDVSQFQNKTFLA